MTYRLLEKKSVNEEPLNLEAYQKNEFGSFFVDFSAFNIIPLKRNDVDPLVFVTNDTET